MQVNTNNLKILQALDKGKELSFHITTRGQSELISIDSSMVSMIRDFCITQLESEMMTAMDDVVEAYEPYTKDGRK